MMTDSTFVRPQVTRPGLRVTVAVVACLVVGLLQAGCDRRRGQPLAGRASAEWARSYTLAEGGELQIVGGVGSIEVRRSDGRAVDVRAERIVHAENDAIARPMVERIRIAEEVSPDKVLLRNDGLGGIVIGVEVEVNFHVSVPDGTKVRLRAAGGDLNLIDLSGPVVASATNGNVAGSGLRGGLEARSVNGNVTIELAAVGQDPVDLRSVNGSIQLTLPATVDANVAANVTNGSIDAGDVPLELTGEQSKRRLRGRLNKGGTPVELTTTNGNIRVRPVQ